MEDYLKKDWEDETRAATLVSPWIIVDEPAWLPWPDGPFDSNYKVGTLDFYFVTRDNSDPLVSIRDVLNALEAYIQNPAVPLQSIEPLVSYGVDVSAEGRLAVRFNDQKIDYTAGCLSIQVDIPGPDS